MSSGDARLFHVNVNCSDLERARRFYTDGLGLTVGAPRSPTLRFVCFRGPDGEVLELIEQPAA